MSPVFWIVIAMFVATDIVVVAVVLRRVMPVVTLFRGLDPERRNRLIQDGHRIAGEFMRTNYSGDPTQLPTALGQLRPQLRDLIRSYGIEPDPTTLDLMIELSAASHRVATRSQLREALRQAA
jgi:hypothetical protein